MRSRAFNAYAPAVLAGIGHLQGTLHDRSVQIRLVRARPGEVTARFDSRRIARERELSRKLARWARDNIQRLEACDPVMPADCFNRLADNWRPLMAIASAHAGDGDDEADDVVDDGGDGTGGGDGSGASGGSGGGSGGQAGATGRQYLLKGINAFYLV